MGEAEWGKRTCSSFCDCGSREEGVMLCLSLLPNHISTRGQKWSLISFQGPWLGEECPQGVTLIVSFVLRWYWFHCAKYEIPLSILSCYLGPTPWLGSDICWWMLQPSLTQPTCSPQPSYCPWVLYPNSACVTVSPGSCTCEQMLKPGPACLASALALMHSCRCCSLAGTSPNLLQQTCSQAWFMHANGCCKCAIIFELLNYFI